jgi:hypothetical protein
MRIFKVIAIGLALSAGWAYAKLGDVVASFPALSGHYNWVRGLARSPIHLFVLGGRYANTVYWVAPNTGSIRGSWTTWTGSFYHGLAYSSGGHIWASTREGMIYDYDAFTGSLYRFWSNPPYRYEGLAPRCTADGGKGTTAIFAGCNSPPFCYRYGIKEGRLLSSFRFEKEYPCDLAWDHRNKILWTGALENKIFGYDVAGSMVAHFWTPSTYNRGLTYYGKYLWVYSYTTKYIYKIHCPSNISAPPASVGKIKSLFY